MTYEVFLRGVILVGVAGLAMRLLRRQAASTRHLVWATVLAVCAGLPILVDIVPTQNLPILPYRNSEMVEPTPGGPRVASPVRVERVRDLPSVQVPEAKIDPWQVAYLLGIVVGLGRVALGMLGVRLLERSSTRLSHNLLPTAPPARAKVLVMPEASPHGAMACGIVKPIVFLPSGFLQWPVERQEAVLRHEFAHLHRGDPATYLLAEIACALNWFNPFVGLGARAMRLEAELAADEVVLEAGMLPSSYATALLSLAAELSPRQRSLQGAIPLMSNPKIEHRIRRVLTSNHPRASRFVLRASAIVALSASVFLVGLRATAAAPQIARTPAEVEAAQSQLKTITLATHMYAADFDEHFPLAESTAKAKQVLAPYVKSMRVFEPTTKGGQVLYNTNLSAVELVNITNIAEVPLWFEKFANPATSVYVGYADGHVKLIQSHNFAEFQRALDASKILRKMARLKGAPKSPSGPGIG